MELQQVLASIKNYKHYIFILLCNCSMLTLSAFPLFDTSDLQQEISFQRRGINIKMNGQYWPNLQMLSTNFIIKSFFFSILSPSSSLYPPPPMISYSSSLSYSLKGGGVFFGVCLSFEITVWYKYEELYQPTRLLVQFMLILFHYISTGYLCQIRLVTK